MKEIVFVSDFLEHHTLPLCKAFCELGDAKIHYIATTPTPKSRLALGYEDMNEKYDFVIPSYKSKEFENKSLEMIKKADLVILGGVWGKYSQLCNSLSIPTMRISERFLKGNLNPLIKCLKILKYKFLARHEKKVVLLCCGSYAVQDFSKTKKYKGRMLKFGYFPKNEIINEKSCSKDKNSMVWAGRFIDWKHPEAIISLAKNLSAKGIDFKINVIGDGPMFPEFKCAVESDANLNDKIRVYGALKFTEVREVMKKSQIHIFTSDCNEGWGAVLNESMNSRCIPIVNKEIGASTYLISDGINGFKYNDLNQFYDLVEKCLLSDEQTKKELSNNAYNTISDLWNCDVCALRILKILEANNNKVLTKIDLYFDGPLSLENA